MNKILFLRVTDDVTNTNLSFKVLLQLNHSLHAIYATTDLISLWPAVDYCFIIYPRKFPSSVLTCAESTQTGEQGQCVSHCTHVGRFVITEMCQVTALHILLYMEVFAHVFKQG